jgi:hypothetical protein
VDGLEKVMNDNDPCVTQPERPRAYDPDIPFSLEQVPNDPIPKKYGIFVVHGIGARDAGATAVVLRDGFENAAEELRHYALKEHQRHPGQPWVEIPPTYIKEGYWGNFGSFKDCFSLIWTTMNQASQKYFEALWQTRAESYVRTAVWYAGQTARLPWDALTQWQDVSGGFFHWCKEILYRVLVRLPLYLLVIFLSWVVLVALLVWPKGRKILSSVLADVRLYVAPRGPIEQAMRQNIDRRVRDLFLQMLGLDQHFNPLPDPAVGDEDPAGCKKLQIGGVIRVFDRVTWVCHSLGTVVSYNVIGELLCECRKQRAAAKAGVVPLGVLRVERGLYRFYTLGSPLRKITWMFPTLLRAWPHGYLDEYVLTDDKDLPKTKENLPDTSFWWINFRHIWDPVSGHISASDLFHWAKDCHSPQVLTVPGVAHVGYWHTDALTKYILAQAHPGMPGATSAKLPKWPQNFLAKIAWHISMIFILGLVCALVFHTVELLGAAALTRLAPWWNWLIAVPILGPILHLIGWIVVKMLCWLAAAANCLWSAVTSLAMQLWIWIKQTVS